MLRPLALALLLAAPAPLFAQSLPATPKGPEALAGAHHRVVRVIDGDTAVVEIDGKATTVRLIGLDTPETVHPSKPVERYGKGASKNNSALLFGALL